MGELSMREEWRCARMDCGGLSVITAGYLQIMTWSVARLGSTLLVKEKAQSYDSHCTFTIVGALFGAFGRGSGPIHLSTVRCSGTEESLFNCFHTNINDVNVFCYSSEPVGVICNIENDTGQFFSSLCHAE